MTEQKTKVQSKRRPDEKKMLLNINGKDIEAREGQTILEAAREYDIYIPSLCFLEGVHQFGGCRMCMVEVEGTRNLVAACMVKAKENMVVKTNSARVRKARKINCELILSNHPTDCLSCERSGQCELQDTARILGITQVRIQGEHSKAIRDMSPAITRDTAKCILCRRCVSVCNQVQGVGVLNAQGRGFQTQIAPAGGASIADVNCTNCGQCVAVCPVGALSETGSIATVWDAINDPDVRVVVQTAPAVRVGLGEEFGIPPGEALTGIMATALKEMMFDDVFDTNFGADLTVMEEGTEFIRRAKDHLQGGKAVLPMITSCSPGWVTFLEHNYPDFTAHLSSCKSPHMMVGAISKAFYAKELGMDPKKMFVVSVMPCTAKKFEITRPEMENDGLRNVDAVITTRELARMIREVGIDFQNLAPSLFDAPLGLSSGAADIFGTTGGVMEAALRTIHEIITGRPLPGDRLNAEESPLSPGIKEAALTFENVLPEYAMFEGFTVRCAVASGFQDAKKLMEGIAAGQSLYHFIEVMGCPGGCVAGGGQPRTQARGDRRLRAEGLLKEDKDKKLRKAHENPAIGELYKTFLGEPLGDRSHDLLHTHYTKRGKYNELLEDRE
ncbi:MAG: NADH-dependent [FeFe] hydrogenase, group A6 [Eubacteriales bacterium]|nr:NADH-dependent [FeFe] hydrogenase, group A6 [Eubacteriales bacterium]MDD4105357.1 NADH-dependent [FeFe] hydrogenase, group A6 [Eubacteriales bacterium]MDD4711261.1 NADH-dependent [FeFe] hydrogenase, group A6 [Eubacteriales bacterium]